MTYTFWVTSDCNFHCKYCYEGEKKVRKSMTKSVVDKSIDFMLENLRDISEEKLNISIHGGEPFLEFDTIKYIVAKVKERCNGRNIHAVFSTTTNASLLNDEIIDFIVKEIPDITVSIDGCKDTHDKMTPFKGGRGSHDIVLKNILKLLEAISDIRVRMTFDSDTANNLSNDVCYLIDKGFKTIVPAANLFDEKWDTNHLKVLEEQMILIKQYVSNKSLIKVSIVDKDIYYEKGKCNGGKTSFHIYPDGKLYPCIMGAGIEEFCIGNIFDGIDNEMVSYLLGHSNVENPDCIGCSLYKWCDGTRCKIVNKVITGDYNRPPLMHCAMENLKYKVN